MDEFRDVVKKLAKSRSDNTAWKILSQLLGPALLSTAYRILRGNLPLAEDATQESFIRLLLYARFEDFKDNPDAFWSYACVICRNVSRTYLRQLLERQELPIAPDLLDQIFLSQTRADPELTVLGDNMLAQIVLRLDGNGRKLLDLILQGYSIHEISEFLGTSYGATAVRIHRLREQIAKWLKIWE
jgi:RNA polymerase sigma factor (sigma-70 family)